MKPTVSIVMTMYNASEYLRECIDSVLGQTFGDFEFIIVDDGSNDDSVCIVRSYADKRIKFLCESHNYIRSLNVGVTACNGKYIAHMDSDDIMISRRIEFQVEFMEQHLDIDVCGGTVEFFGNYNFIAPVLVEHIDIVSSMILSSPLYHSTVIFRSERLMKEFTKNGFCHLYDENYIYAEDCRLWIDLATRGYRFANLPIVIVKYRKTNKQITSSRVSEVKKSLRKARAELFTLISQQIIDSNDSDLIHSFKQANFMYKQKILSRNSYLKSLTDIQKALLQNNYPAMRKTDKQSTKGEEK